MLSAGVAEGWGLGALKSVSTVSPAPVRYYGEKAPNASWSPFPRNAWAAFGMRIDKLKMPFSSLADDMVNTSRGGAFLR